MVENVYLEWPLDSCILSVLHQQLSLCFNAIESGRRIKVLKATSEAWCVNVEVELGMEVARYIGELVWPTM